MNGMIYRPYGTAIGGSDGGECDTFKFTWPSDVDRMKARLDTVVQALNLSVAGCPNLPAGEAQAWRSFIAEWGPFRARVTPTFGSSNEWEAACSYARTIDAWQTKLAQYCTIVGPGEIKGSGNQTTDLVRWMTIGLIALGGIVVFATFAPEIKAALHR